MSSVTCSMCSASPAVTLALCPVHLEATLGSSRTELPLIQIKAHSIAVEKVWYGPEGAAQRNIGEVLMLMTSELAEALEEWRSGRSLPEVRIVEGKPEGFGVELADCIIRILDIAQHIGLDMASLISEKMEYNRSRPYRHGGKVA